MSLPVDVTPPPVAMGSETNEPQAPPVNDTNYSPFNSPLFTQTTLHDFDDITDSTIPRQIQPNEPWGRLPTEKAANSSRIIFNNVNGISTWNNLSDMEYLAEACEQHQGDLIGLAETNLPWHDPMIRDTFMQKLLKYWKSFKVAVCSSIHHPAAQRYQPGGTAMIVREPWKRYTRMSRDPSGMGRWTEATITRKMDRTLTVFTAYRVCKSSPEEMGPTTAYKQQWTILRSKGIVQPDPRQRLLDDLRDRIKELQLLNHSIILMMDANESLAELGPLTSWVRDLDLQDVHATLHGIESEPETYIRGSHRIDYVFVSPNLVDYVQHASIRPYAEFVNSDHRALIVDIELTGFLRCTPASTIDTTARGIGSSQPGRIKFYRKKLKDFLDRSDIESTIAQLNEDAQCGRPVAHTILDDIDKSLTECFLQLDQQCTHIPDHPWSPELLNAKKTLEFWKMWRTEIRTCRDLSQQRERLQLHLVPTVSKLTKYQILHGIRNAAKQFRKAIADGDALREKHLDRCAAMAAASGKIKHEAAIKRIKRSELSRRTFQRIRRAMGKTKSGQLDYIIDKPRDTSGNFCTDDDGNDIEIVISDPQAINDRIIERNQHHFSQAEGTPFAHPTLRDLFGRFGTNANSQKLLAGSLDIADLEVTDATKAILQRLRRAAPPNSIQATLTADDLRAGYKVWRESTATSPSGRHLGHDKVLFCYEPNTPNDDPDAPPRLSTRPLTSQLLCLTWLPTAVMSLNDGGQFTR